MCIIIKISPSKKSTNRVLVVHFWTSKIRDNALQNYIVQFIYIEHLWTVLLSICDLMLIQQTSGFNATGNITTDPTTPLHAIHVIRNTVNWCFMHHMWAQRSIKRIHMVNIYQIDGISHQDSFPMPPPWSKNTADGTKHPSTAQR